MADQSDEDPVEGPAREALAKGSQQRYGDQEYGNLPQLYAAVEGEEGKEPWPPAYCRPSVMKAKPKPWSRPKRKARRQRGSALGRRPCSNAMKRMEAAMPVSTKGLKPWGRGQELKGRSDEGEAMGCGEGRGHGRAVLGEAGAA